MKKFLKVFLIAFIVAVVWSMNTFLITHNLKLDLINEFEYNGDYKYAYGEKYFFIKDDDYNCFYDGKEILKSYLPEYELSSLDTDDYTYMISVNRKINSVKYNGRNCKLRTYFLLPDEYEAIIESEETDDAVIRIYRMKKINIDYDYHSE